MTVEKVHEEDCFVIDVGRALILKQENREASFSEKKTKKLSLLKDFSAELNVVMRVVKCLLNFQFYKPLHSDR